MRLNMQRIRRRKDNLAVKAPLDGVLGLIEVGLGESVSSGRKIGQISAEGSDKIEAQIDESVLRQASLRQKKILCLACHT